MIELNKIFLILGMTILIMGTVIFMIDGVLTKSLLSAAATGMLFATAGLIMKKRESSLVKVRIDQRR